MVLLRLLEKAGPSSRHSHLPGNCSNTYSNSGQPQKYMVFLKGSVHTQSYMVPLRSSEELTNVSILSFPIKKLNPACPHNN